MDKFSKLIAQGVAEFKYTPIASSTPVQCPVCRMYNNVFAIANGTHMSPLEDGKLVITGAAIRNRKDFDRFLYSCIWRGIDFTSAGLTSPSEFLYANKLKGHYDILNGDQVYMIEHAPEELDRQLGCPDCVQCDSGIREALRMITTDGNVSHVAECFQQKDVAKALNESAFIRGNNWVPVGMSDGEHFVSVGRRKTYIL